MTSNGKTCKMQRDLDAEATKMAAEMLPRVQQKLQERITVAVTPSGKIRRNGPCPCGSNKKFKSCCLRRTREGGDLQRITKSEVNNHRV